MAPFDLLGKVAFITGGNGGIGFGMAKGLAGAGATVVIGGRDRAKGERALAELRTIGKAHFVQMHARDEISCREAVERAAALFGRLALTRQARTDVPGLHERVLARAPAQRWGRPNDFAGIAVFLASEASNFVTGAAIPVDGGYSILA